MRTLGFGLSLLLTFVLVLERSAAAQLGNTFTNWIAHPAIAYTTKPVTDPVARLNRSLQTGEARLQFEGRSGFLRSTLVALHVPVESQVAVFGKDSLQRDRISTMSPRAIFFNDTLSVAWVRDGFIELASQDPQQGVVFYILENEPNDKPRFVRREDCLSCHYSYSTVGVPGMVDQGFNQLKVDHTTPFERRWGGWYVTGQPTQLRHLGNPAAARPESASATWPSLEGRFDLAGYLSPHSDIVALMTFNHQMRGMNLIARIGWEARVAEFQRTQMPGPGLAAPGPARDAPVAMDAAARELVDYFLFVDEAPLTAAVRGSSGFAERFEADGRRDRQGRSLRQLDLQTRLLRYPCSYLIYTDAFDALPRDARDAIYRRMWQVLSGMDKDPRYRRLSPADRRAVIEILRDTRNDLPAEFK